MLNPLRIPNAYFYSQMSLGDALVANAYLFTSDAGNTMVDPLPIDDDTAREIDEFGGVSRVVVMTTARQAAAREIAAHYRAPLIASPRHRETLAPGMIAIGLPDQKTSYEFAVTLPRRETVLVGDALLGSPAGALSMAPENAYGNPRGAALGLRRILRENPQTLLVSFGQSIFCNAYDALYQLLYARAGAEVLRINVDELEFRDDRAEGPEQPPQYACEDAEVGFGIGARKLGYRVARLEPGQRFCPLHGHAREEELFFVLDGEPSIRTLAGTLRCRKGDFIAFPVGETGTHQLLNEGSAPATVILLGRTANVEACYYPDSDKLLVDVNAPFANGRASIMVRGSPDLDYFHGEA
jgi:uncharacterized cupin superfamily protein